MSYKKERSMELQDKVKRLLAANATLRETIKAKDEEIDSLQSLNDFQQQQISCMQSDIDKMINYIIICNTENENIAVQAKILALGGKWVSGKTDVQHTDKPVLVFDDLNSDERAMSYHEAIMSDEYKKWSCYKNHKTMTAIEFLRMRKI